MANHPGCGHSDPNHDCDAFMAAVKREMDPMLYEFIGAGLMVAKLVGVPVENIYPPFGDIDPETGVNKSLPLVRQVMIICYPDGRPGFGVHKDVTDVRGWREYLKEIVGETLFNDLVAMKECPYGDYQLALKEGRPMEDLGLDITEIPDWLKKLGVSG